MSDTTPPIRNVASPHLVGSFGFTLAVAWAIFASVAAIALGIGWWNERSDAGTRVESERADARSPGRDPTPGQGAPTDSPAAQSYLEHPESAAIAADARCPHCGEPLPRSSPSLDTAPSPAPMAEPAPTPATESVPTPSPANKAWPPRSLANLPGATLREKLVALANAAREKGRGVTPDDILARSAIRKPVEEILGEAGDEDPAGFRRALLDLFRDERDEFVAELLGKELKWPALKDATAAENKEFDQMLAQMLESADPFDRRKALRASAYLNTPEAFDRWRQALTLDPDSTVRATAAAAIPIHFNEARALMLQAALYDPDAQVRANAVGGLSHGATQAEFRALIGLLRQEKEVRVQKAILWTFQLAATARDTEVRDVALELAQDASRNPEIRRDAIDLLLHGANSQGMIQDDAQRKQLEDLMFQMEMERAGVKMGTEFPPPK